MHELSLVRDAVRRVEAAAREAGGGRVAAVRLSFGPLAGLSADHLRRHFREAARGTRVEGARVDVQESEALAGEGADGLRVESIEIEE